MPLHTMPCIPLPLLELLRLRRLLHLALLPSPLLLLLYPLLHVCMRPHQDGMLSVLHRVLLRV